MTAIIKTTNSLALAMYSIGMVAYGLRDVLGKIFYSLQDTKTPMINGVIAMGVNMVMDVVFIQFWGLAGLTVATSLSDLLSLVLSSLLLFFASLLSESLFSASLFSEFLFLEDDCCSEVEDCVSFAFSLLLT